MVVRGYQKEQVSAPGVRFVDNDRWAETGELSLALRAPTPSSAARVVVLYGDIIFEPHDPGEARCAQEADVAVVVDRAFPDTLRAGEPLPPGPLDLVVTETPPQRPPLRRAGRRQPRAADRPRGDAR